MCWDSTDPRSDIGHEDGPTKTGWWQVSDGRIERLWRREGLKVPAKQPKTRAALAKRRILRSSSAGVSEPCLVV